MSLTSVLRASNEAMDGHVPVVSAEGIVKEFLGADGATIRVLDDVSLTVDSGEMVAVIGSSGAGKSTLLHVMGALEQPTVGKVQISGRDVAHLSDEEIARLRNANVGFVFQFHHLLKEFSALENVMMPLLIAGVSSSEARERAELLLDRVGMRARQDHRPSALSGGEQQRTAVARALANNPRLLLADEPSGNLDLNNAERLHELFSELASELRIAIIVVTHNQSLAARADRVLTLEGGRLMEVRNHREG